MCALAVVIAETAQHSARLGMRRYLMHGVGRKWYSECGAGCARLLKDVCDVSKGHGRVGDALRPTMLADSGAARHLYIQHDLSRHCGHPSCHDGRKFHHGVCKE